LKPREYDGDKKRYPSTVLIGDRIFVHGESWVAADVVITKTGVQIRPKSGITSYLICPFCDCKVQNPMRKRWAHCICGVGYMIGESGDADKEWRLVENYDPMSGMVVSGLTQSVLEMLSDSGLVSVVFERARY